MLKTLRDGAKNVVVKVLLILVALSFVVWGIGDIFRGGSASGVATIGKEAISFNDYNTALRRQVDRYGQLFGHSLSEEEISALNLRRQVVEQLIQNNLLKQRAADLHLAVGDKVIRDRIANTQAFYDKDGKFSKTRFESILRANGLNEAYYVNALRQDLAVSFLVNGLLESAPENSAMVNKLYDFRNEKRVADLLLVPAGFIKEVPEPTDAQLLDYYNKHTGEFTLPEMRKVSYVILNPEVVAKETALSDADLKAWYDDHQSKYQLPETRKVEQYLFDDEAAAKKAYDDLKAGKAVSEKKTDLGEITKAGMPGTLGDAIFSLKEDEYSDPVQSDLGWHIFRVNKVTESHVPDFAKVKDKVKQDAEAERGSTAFQDLSNDIEDDLASGMRLAEVAKKRGLKVKTIAELDEHGKDAHGDAVKDVPSPDVFLPLAFKTAEGDVSSLTLLPDNQSYLVLEVESKTPERLQALDEVRGRAVLKWKENKHNEMLKSYADELAKKMKSGAEIAKLSAVPGLKFLPERTLEKPKDGTASTYPNAFVNELFTLQTSQSTGAYLMTDGGYVIGRLQHIVDVDDSKNPDPAGHNQLSQEVKGKFGPEIMEQYFDYLKSIYPVHVNDQAIKSNEG